MKEFFLAIAMSATALQAQMITEINHPVKQEVPVIQSK